MGCSPCRWGGHTPQGGEYVLSGLHPLLQCFEFRGNLFSILVNCYNNVSVGIGTPSTNLSNMIRETLRRAIAAYRSYRNTLGLRRSRLNLKQGSWPWLVLTSKGSF